MEDIAGALGALGFFGFVGFLVWVISRRKQADRQMMFEAQKQILDKIGSGPEVTQFLSSEDGREFLNRLREPEKPKQNSALAWVGGTMLWGLVATGVGVGFFLAARVTDVELFIPAGICMGAGIGLLIASWISYRLSKKWGLIQKEISAGPESQAS